MGGRTYHCACGWHETENEKLLLHGDYATCLECEEDCDIYPGLDWVICGGETGKNARPMHPQWARDLRDQCKASDTPFFFKQRGEYKCWDDLTALEKELYFHRPSEPGFMVRLGHRAAGRVLDGETYSELPEVSR
jgi:protein gp37